MTSYVEGVAAGYVATNAPDYTGLLTNLLAFHGESGVVMRAYGDTNVAFGAPDLATKATVTIVSNAFGTADNTLSGQLVTAYGTADNTLSGQLVTAYSTADNTLSGQLVTAYGVADLVVSNAYTNTKALAAAALPKAGGTMTGPIDMGGQAMTNADYVTTTNYVWVPVNGTVYFGTTTNYIKDQGGTNFMFKAGTNSANFGW